MSIQTVDHCPHAHGAETTQKGGSKDLELLPLCVGCVLGLGLRPAVLADPIVRVRCEPHLGTFALLLAHGQCWSSSLFPGSTADSRVLRGSAPCFMLRERKPLAWGPDSDTCLIRTNGMSGPGARRACAWDLGSGE